MRSALLSFLFFLVSSNSFAHNDVCVLNYEFANHPYSKHIRDIFKPSESVRLKEEAIPTDFLDCVHDGYSEIIIVAHAGGRPIKDKAMFAFIDHDSQGRPFPVPFMPRVFKEAREHFWRLKEQGQPIPLKRIRIVSCLKDDLLNTYWDLKALLFENNIQLDMAPDQIVMTLIMGRKVTALDLVWIAESAQFPTPDDYFYTYIDLKTIGLVRFGSRTGMRGQYKIDVTDGAVGLAYKWSTILVKYNDVKDLEPGQSKSILTPTIDAAAAFWLNIEASVFPTPKLQLPSEINSIGLSVGIFSHIKITRIY